METEEQIFVELFKKAKLTQKDFAKRVGMAQPDISNYLRGVDLPKLSSLRRWAAKLGLKIEVKFTVVKDEDNRKPQALVLVRKPPVLPR